MCMNEEGREAGKDCGRKMINELCMASVSGESPGSV